MNWCVHDNTSCPPSWRANWDQLISPHHLSVYTIVIGLSTEMVHNCCVYSCHMRRGRDKGVSLYVIPSVISNQGKDRLKVSSRRRDAWIATINLKDNKLQSMFTSLYIHQVSYLSIKKNNKIHCKKKSVQCTPNMVCYVCPVWNTLYGVK